MHADDARHLYVDVAAPLAERAVLSITSGGDEDSEAFRASRAESPARSMKEAEGELEKLLASGYRTVVAFDGLGEAERARYNLDRLDVAILDGRPLSPDPGLAFAEARLREGFVSPELRLAVYPFRRLVHRRRRAEDGAPGAGAAASPSPSCGSATTSSTRTTASPASPASRPARSAASPATTSTSSTRARTGSTSPPTSSRSSPATSAPAASRRSRRSAASAGRT